MLVCRGYSPKKSVTDVGIQSKWYSWNAAADSKKGKSVEVQRLWGIGVGDKREEGIVGLGSRHSWRRLGCIRRIGAQGLHLGVVEALFG